MADRLPPCGELSSAPTRTSGPPRPEHSDRGDLGRPAPLAEALSATHVLHMFVVTEADAAAIRDIFEREGEFAAAMEVRRRFRAITDNDKAREQARVIAGWRLLPQASERAGRCRTRSLTP